MAIRNWAGNQVAHPSDIARPTSVDQVCELVGRAAGDGRRVRAIGSGHSFTSIAMSDATMVRTDGLDTIHLDGDRVTVGGGVTLHRLNDTLAAVGLALPVLGDIDRQTVVGATATGTHGTGVAHPAIAASVIGFELVDGHGTLRRAAVDGTADERELLRVGRVHLGALGLITSVTLQCVPAFNLRAVDRHERVADILGDFDGFVNSADHVEFFWMGGARRVVARRNDRTAADPNPPSAPRRFLDQVVIENAGFGAFCAIGRRFPNMIPKVARHLLSASSERDVVDRSDRVFVSRRLVKFVEMEYGVPYEHIPELLPEAMAIVTDTEFPVLFPIEVRVSAADDIPLSPGSGRANGWIAIHQYRGAPHEEFFERFETLVNQVPGARPHWGKMHSLGADDLRDRYAGWDEFHRMRDALDPDRVFGNDYTDRVLD